MNKSVHLSPSRRFLFIIISTIILPVLFFLFVELSLRIFNFGDDTRYLKKCEYEGCSHYVDNPEFTRQFFSKELARSALPVRVPYQKSDNTYRIYVLGASAAAGYPLSDFGFSRILNVMLDDKFPGVDFEVINVSNVAINSHVVLKIVQELKDHSPDMFIMYLGNNEVVGPYGPGTVFNAFNSSLPFIRSGIAINSLKISQLVKHLLGTFSSQTNAQPQKWKGMSMFANSHVAADDPRLKSTYQFFKANIQDVAKISAAHSDAFIVSTVASNIKDLAPFASSNEALQDDAFNALYQRGVAYEEEGDYEKAVQTYLNALEYHSSFADLYFRLGRSYIQLGNNSLAKKYLDKARDLDELRFRADSSINQIIKDVANSSEHIYLVDAEKQINVMASQEIAGAEYFYEHVHFNFEGQYALAKLFFYAIKERLPLNIVKMENQDKDVIAQENVAEYLGLTEYEELLAINHMLDRLVDGEPFTNISNYDEVIGELTDRKNTLDQYIIDNGFNDIIEHQIAALNRDPSDPWHHYHLGRLLIQIGKPEKALPFLEFAVRELPSLKGSQQMLDLAYEKTR